MFPGETRNRIRYGFGQYISITGDTFIGKLQQNIIHLGLCPVHLIFEVF